MATPAKPEPTPGELLTLVRALRRENDILRARLTAIRTWARLPKRPKKEKVTP
jgi:hypothetical protein